MTCFDLQPFVCRVPHCESGASVAMAVAQFDRGDRLLVLDPQQRPLGVVLAQRLLPHLQDPTLWRQPLMQLSHTFLPAVEVRGRMVNGQLHGDGADLDRLRVGEAVGVVVDDGRKVRGVLDRDRLFAALPQSAPQPPRDEPTAANAARIESLNHLLRLLPLPACVQTGDRVQLAQNTAWQSWCDRAVEPQAIDRLAATVSDRGDRADSRVLGTVRVLDPAGNSQPWQIVAVCLSQLCPSPTCAPPSPPRLPALAVLAASTSAPETLPLNDVPEPLSQLWLLLAQDVTERSDRTQELSAKNADLIQTDRQRTELLSWVGHELKNPLTSLLGLSNLLQHPNLGTLNPRQANYARLIQQSSRQMMAIVNDLCDLGQLERDELVLHYQQLPVGDCIDAARERVAQLYSARHDDEPALPHFSLDLAANAATVVADRTRLCQILAALIANAVRSTPAEGTVGLRVERWNDWIAFVVWDTGTGIQPERQPWIFHSSPIAGDRPDDPSDRDSPSIQPGLELVLAQRLARLHGGEISFTSGEDRGSQFTLLLPNRTLVEPEMARTDTSANVSVAGTDTLSSWASDRQTRFALLVDRNPARVSGLSDCLAAAGYRVLLARSGSEALAKARQLQPQAIFLNPVLPILSGWDVLTLLKSDAATRELPVVLLGDGDRPHLPDTVLDWLPLPIDRTHVRSLLDRLVTPVSPSRELTVLWLVSGNPNPASAALERLFHQHHYRVVEVDDLEQADMLAKVWKPDVVLIDRAGDAGHEVAFVEDLAQHADLTELPIVTLDAATTAAANGTVTPKGRSLTVFPCLTAPDSVSELSRLPAVLEVVQIAAKVRE